MKRLARLILLLALGLLFAAGCGGGSSSKTKTAQLRMVNSAGGFGSAYDILVGGASFTTNLIFSNATAYATLNSGSEQIEFRAVGTSSDVINQTVNLTGGSTYTFVAMGPSSQVGGVNFTDNTTAATSGNIQLRIINASISVSSMDIYILPSPGDCYSTVYNVSANVSALAFGTASDYKTFTAGDYQVCATQHGSKSANLATGQSTYSSGAVKTIIIQDSNDGNGPLAPLTLTDAS